MPELLGDQLARGVRETEQIDNVMTGCIVKECGSSVYRKKFFFFYKQLWFVL